MKSFRDVTKAYEKIMWRFMAWWFVLTVVSVTVLAHQMATFDALWKRFLVLAIHLICMLLLMADAHRQESDVYENSRRLRL